MKRLLAFSALAAVIAPALIPAEASVARMSTPANHQLISTSRNDRWGVGYIGDGTSGSTGGFRWNLVTGKIDNVGTISDAGGIAVDNNGVVYGFYKITEPSGAERMSPGYYKNGAWHPLELPTGFSGGGLDACCSSDGRFVAMTLDDPTGHLTPVVWRDGVPYIVATNGDYCRVSCITEDGSMIGGWMNTSNRQNTIWTFDGNDYTDFMHPGSTPKWTDNVMGFTTDNHYALVDDGWDYNTTGDELHYFGYYDLQTKEMLPIVVPDNVGSAIYMFNMSGDGHTIGSYNGTAMLVTPDRKAHILMDWLKENHDVDVHDFPEIITYENVFRLERGMTVNNGATKFGFIYYGEYPGVDDYYPFYSMFLDVNADPENATPLDLRASKFAGIPSLSLEWDIPFACERTISGYDIYRDGEKVNAEPVTGKIFYDKNVTPGTHRYQVRTLFEGGESELSEPFEYEMEEAIVLNAPQAFTGRQRGFNRVNLDWAAPVSNSGHLSYSSNDASTEGIGTNFENLTMEVGIKFPAEVMNLYNNATLRSVSFTPLSDCDKWTVCLYNLTASGALREIYSQEVTQPINVGENNDIELTTPYVADGKDLIIGIQAFSSQPNVRLFGFQEGVSKPGLSDLIRMVDGSNLPFDSFYNISGEAYSSPMEISWKMSANFVPEGTADDINRITSYTILADGNEIASVEGTGTILENIADGEHTFAIRANYATGSSSKDVETVVNVDAASKALAVEAPEWTVDKETGDLDVTWKAPVDDDATLITYTTGPRNNSFKPFIQGANEMYAGTLFPSGLYKTYRNYEIRTISFVPACEADFSYELLKDGQVIAEGDIDSYEIGVWNKITLPEPVEFNPLSDYEIHFNAYDFAENTAPFYMSTDPLITGKGDLLSMDGSEWFTVLGLSGQAYNWMMSLGIAEKDSERAMPIEGYDVTIDSKAVNDKRVEGTSYKFRPTTSGSHELAVDAYYPGLANAVKGIGTLVVLESGVGDMKTIDVDIKGGKGCILVKGDNVSAIEVIDLEGRTVARGAAGTARIDGLASGLYVVKATVAGKTEEIAKINVL